MTEAEWVGSRDPGGLAEYLAGRQVSWRKSRLAACGCCRRVWALMTFGSARQLVDLVEQSADGSIEFDAAWADADALSSAARVATQDSVHYRPTLLAAAAAAHAAYADLSGEFGSPESFSLVLVEAADAAVVAGEPAGFSGAYSEIEKAFCAILRDVFGNPFRPVCIDPSWCTPTVLNLARRVYESRDFTAFPILADALQDAGCDAADILDHCRGGGTHVRGCWVVDLVLGKE